MAHSPLAAGNWILRNCVWLWFLWCAVVILGIALDSWWFILWPAFTALILAVLLGVWAALHHIYRAAVWCRETFSGFPPIWGNPRAPGALLAMIAYWIGLLLASGVLVKGLSRYAAMHIPMN